MKIDTKYKIPLQGEYHRGIFYCPNCGISVDTADETIGFAESDMGIMVIIECPECFTKWYFHNSAGTFVTGLTHYYWFLESIKLGTNKHFT
jgi:RNase P subunit RPR2